MIKDRNDLPQMGDELFLADGGIETTLVFHERIDLPHFAAFTLLDGQEGLAALRRYFGRYADIARRTARGIVLETPTWRANADWGRKLGYDAAALVEANRKAVDLLLQVRAAYETPRTRIVVSGNVGPRGDGYRPDSCMTAGTARAYHAPQIDVLAEAGADMAAAFTMNYVEEAIGVVLAARDAHVPVAISYTVETDGRLPSGATLADAIARADDATAGYAAYYMINCAHPTHFARTVRGAGSWIERIRGVRANASRRSHAELEESADLDAGDPQELAWHYRELMALIPRLTVVGGCCGTDHRHIEAISEACGGTRAWTVAA